MFILIVSKSLIRHRSSRPPTSSGGRLTDMRARSIDITPDTGHSHSHTPLAHTSIRRAHVAAPTQHITCAWREGDGAVRPGPPRPTPSSSRPQVYAGLRPSCASPAHASSESPQGQQSQLQSSPHPPYPASPHLHHTSRQPSSMRRRHCPCPLTPPAAPRLAAPRAYVGTTARLRMSSNL